MYSSRLQQDILYEAISFSRSTMKKPDEYYEEINSELLDLEKYDPDKYKLKRATKLGINSLYPNLEDFRISDIVQGELQNCWIISAICAVVNKRHEHLKSIILKERLQKDGRYVVRLCVAGRWRLIHLDDRLPYRLEKYLQKNPPPRYNNDQNENDDRPSLLFSSSTKHLYVPLIEKAFAIALGHRCYSNLNVGFSYEALSALTGSPTTKLIFDPDCTINHQWNIIVNANHSGFPMTASCGNGALSHMKKEYFESQKLRPKHSYTVVNVDHITNCIQLYNPWGFFQPDHCEEDGTFWMKFNDFVRYFDSVDICRFMPGLEELRFRSLGVGEIIRMRIEHTQHLHCALFQELPEDRQIKKDICLVVMNEKHDIVASTDHRRFEAFVELDVTLNAGDYYLVPISFHHLESELSGALNISIHSITTIHGSVISNSGRMVRSAVLNLVKRFGHKLELYPEVNVRVLSRQWNGLLITVENMFEKQFVHICCDSSTSQNVISTRNSLIVCDSIPPEHEQIVFILTQSLSSEQMIINHSISHVLSKEPTLPDFMITTYNNKRPHENGDSGSGMNVKDNQMDDNDDNHVPAVSHLPELDTDLYRHVLHSPTLLRHKLNDSTMPPLSPTTLSPAPSPSIYNDCFDPAEC